MILLQILETMHHCDAIMCPSDTDLCHEKESIGYSSGPCELESECWDMLKKEIKENQDNHTCKLCGSHFILFYANFTTISLSTYQFDLLKKYRKNK